MTQCPSPFVPYNGACIQGCPQRMNEWEFTSVNNQPRCVLKADNTKGFSLVPVTSLQVPVGEELPTVYELANRDPSRYQLYETEMTRVQQETLTILEQQDKQTRINTAFDALQKAENIRDQSPEGYQRARSAYYSLTRGPEWFEDEKKRIAKVEVEPDVSRYRSSYDILSSRQQQQQRTQDIMNSVKDGVLTLKDDFQYTTNAFKEQIENLKNQINIERRGRGKVEGEGTEFYKWVDALLNLFIIAGLLYAVFVFWQKLSVKSSQPAYAPMVVTT